MAQIINLGRVTGPNSLTGESMTTLTGVITGDGERISAQEQLSVSMGGTGAAAAGAARANIGAGSSRNLLHNWDFRDPVNRRGESSYTGAGHTIDRWELDSALLSVQPVDGGLMVTRNAGSGGGNLYQRIDVDTALLVGKRLVFSCEVNGTVSSASGIVPERSESNQVFASGRVATGFNIYMYHRSNGELRAYFILSPETAGQSFLIACAKVELSEVSTLAEDPPADHAAQYAIAAQYDALSGRYLGVSSGSNPNMLHNWDFRHPINQRGGASYAAAGYTIDRWRMSTAAMTATLGAEGLTLVNSGTANANFFQILDVDADAIEGSYVTISCEVGEKVYYATGVVPARSTQHADVARVALPGTSAASLLLSRRSDGTLHAYIIVAPTGEGSGLTVSRVKAEPGQGCTLAGDLPMDQAVELLRCRRFYEEGVMEMVMPIGYSAPGNMPAYATIPFAAVKRAVPAIRIFHPVTGQENVLYNLTRAQDNAVSGGVETNATVNSFRPVFKSIAAAVTQQNVIKFKWTASAEL